MIGNDVKITINLNKLVEARAKLLTQYGDESYKIVRGEYLNGCLLYTSDAADE